MTQETWKVKSDKDAERIIEKVNDDLVETRRFKKSIEEKMKDLKDKLLKVEEEEKQAIERRDSYLLEYFETIDPALKKKTKTQEKYRLPSGEIIKKYPGHKFERDNDKLSQWLESAKLTEFVEIKKQAKWGDFKKSVEKETVVVDNQLIFKNTGEVIEGVSVIDRPPTLEFKEVK